MARRVDACVKAFAGGVNCFCEKKYFKIFLKK